MLTEYIILSQCQPSEAPKNPSEDFICQSFVDTLWLLLKDNTISTITASNIINISKRSRSSFYRRFEDKYCLLLYALRTKSKSDDLFNIKKPLVLDDLIYFINLIKANPLQFIHAFQPRSQSQTKRTLAHIFALKIECSLLSGKNPISKEFARAIAFLYAHEILGHLEETICSEEVSWFDKINPNFILSVCPFCTTQTTKSQTTPPLP